MVPIKRTRVLEALGAIFLVGIVTASLVAGDDGLETIAADETVPDADTSEFPTTTSPTNQRQTLDVTSTIDTTASSQDPTTTATTSSQDTTADQDTTAATASDQDPTTTAGSIAADQAATQPTQGSSATPTSQASSPDSRPTPAASPKVTAAGTGQPLPTAASRSVNTQGQAANEGQSKSSKSPNPNALVVQVPSTSTKQANSPDVTSAPNNSTASSSAPDQSPTTPAAQASGSSSSVAAAATPPTTASTVEPPSPTTPTTSPQQTSSAPASTVIPPSNQNYRLGSCWGNPVGHSGYSPTEIGETPGRGRNWFLVEAHSARFVSPVSANLISVRTYAKHSVGTSAFYGDGDGGIVEYTVETDDGSSLHAPSGQILGTTGLVVPAPKLSGTKYASQAIINPYGDRSNEDSSFLRYDFKEPIPVSRGQVLHLITQNRSANVEQNSIAHNNNQQWKWENGTHLPDNNRDQHLWDTCSNRSPLEGGVLFRLKGSNSWQLKPAQHTITEYYFDDGTVWGDGVGTIAPISGDSNRMHNVNGSAKVRQTFTPSSNRSVCSVGVRLAKNSGSGPGGARLKILEAGGSEIWQHEFAGNAFPSSADTDQPTVASMTADWAEARTSTPIQFQAGKTYYLEISAAPGSSYRVGAYKQTEAGNYHPSSYFSEGSAEYAANGTSWTDFQRDGRNAADISFVFRNARTSTSCT